MLLRRLVVASLCVCPIACGAGGSDTGQGSSGDGTSTGEAGEATDGSASTASTAELTSSGADTGAASEAGSGSSSGGEPAGPSEPTMLPSATGTCPTLAAGDVMFAPAGIEPRAVKLWLSDAAKTKPGPLVFYWHGTGSSPDEATYGLGKAYVDQVVAQGGVVVAPYHDPEAGDFPWWLVLGDREDDLILADEVLACAREQLMVDVTHIHVAGMSAGGLQTSQMSFRRAGYVASAVPYSGGVITVPPDQEPMNPLSAMIFHGGPDDIVLLHFEQTSAAYKAAIEAKGGFAFLCDHGMGHSIPQGAAQESVWRFFLDHPYGTRPSPYAGGLPDGFPEYCALK